MLHSKGLLHRDIKPDNFVMGLHKNKNIVYVIDYGLAKRFLMGAYNTHIPFADKRSLVGTIRYCSINSQLGYEQSRRDDLESLCYSIIYLLKGRLPWQGLIGEVKDDKCTLILNKKQQDRKSVV